MSRYKLSGLYKVVDILRSYSFRYSSRGVLIFSIIVFFMLALVYGIFSYRLFHDVHSGLSAELETVKTIYVEKGEATLTKYMDAQIYSWHREQYAYLLVDDNLKKLSGTLDGWPDFAEYGDGWLSFEINILSSKGEKEHDFVARSVMLPDGRQLLVAQDFQRITRIIQFVLGILINGFIVTLTVGLIGAYYVTANFIARLNRFNVSIDAIVKGDLTERMSVGNRSTEIAKLAINMNFMLDRIAELMEGVTQVSDNIAHDLRTPLTRLRNHLATFENQSSDEDKDSVRGLIEETDNILSTFNSLLRIARIEIGEKVKKSHIDLRHLVEELLELYEPLATEKNITLDVSLVKADIAGDRNLIFQATANILDNAIKYTPPAGRISLNLKVIDVEGEFDVSEALEQQPKTVVLTIADSGCGVNAENIPKLTRRFYREESSRGCLPGSGLGLSLVSAVVKIHDGELRMANAKEGGLIVEMRFVAV